MEAVKVLEKWAGIIGAGAGVFSVTVAIVGWVFIAGQRDAQLASTLDDVAMIRSTVTTMAGIQTEQGKAIARIEGRLQGLPNPRLGALP